MAESATQMRARERWLLPVPEACAGLGVGRSTLYALAKRGDIEMVHVGSRALVPAASIDAFVSSLRADQGSGVLVGETGEYDDQSTPARMNEKAPRREPGGPAR